MTQHPERKLGNSKLKFEIKRNCLKLVCDMFPFHWLTLLVVWRWLCLYEKTLGKDLNANVVGHTSNL